MKSTDIDLCDVGRFDTIFSFLGRLPQGLRWVNLVMFTMIIAQYITAGLSSNIGLIALLSRIPSQSRCGRILSSKAA